jgi:hypothetical protein
VVVEVGSKFVTSFVRASRDGEEATVVVVVGVENC